MSSLWTILAAGVLLTTFGANELTHGGMAEALDMGHHHMLDHGGYHCAGHDDGNHAQQHQQHMHGQASENGTGASHPHAAGHPHASCYDEGGPMHDQHQGMHEGSHQGGMQR